MVYKFHGTYILTIILLENEKSQFYAGANYILAYDCTSHIFCNSVMSTLPS